MKVLNMVLVEFNGNWLDVFSLLGFWYMSSSTRDFIPVERYDSCCDVISHAVWKNRTWVTAESFTGEERVGCWLEAQVGKGRTFSPRACGQQPNLPFPEKLTAVIHRQLKDQQGAPPTKLSNGAKSPLTKAFA